MAIYEGPFASGMRGKLGNVVGAKTVGGRTALRAYKEHIKNPNTRRQRSARALMSAASKVAAIISEAIGIGYAKASQGLKMYPRNVAIKDLLGAGSPIVFEDGEFTEFNAEALKVSKAEGITVQPNVTLTASAGSDNAKATVTNSAEVPVNVGEEVLGVVLVLVDPIDNNFAGTAKVICSTTMSNIDLTADAVGKNVYAFFKKVPASRNTISTDVLPWKYPSATGASIFVGAAE